MGEEPVMSKTFIFLVAILFVLTIVQVKPYSDPPKKGEDAGEEDMETTTEPTADEEKPDAGERKKRESPKKEEEDMETTTEPWDEDEPDAGERKKRESPKKEEEDMESTTEPWNDGDYGDE